MRALNYVLGALFLFGAIVQFNDPDPLLWAAIYLAAAVVTFMAARRPDSVVGPLVVGVIAAVWALTLASGATVPIFGLFEQWEMRNEAVEVSREFYGLAIIGIWMAVLTGLALSRRRRGGAATAA